MLNIKPYLREIKLDVDDIENRDVYPFNIPALRKFTSMTFHPDVTFIIGENGSGKSTLVEAIAMLLGFGQEGGTLNMQFKNADTLSGLHEHLKGIRGASRPRDSYFLRAESFYNVATYIDEEIIEDERDKLIYLNAYGGKSMHNRSHGEVFFTTLTNKFHGKGLYILDEPEAALSPNRQMAALAQIHDLVKRDSQFIIATHSPILMAYPRAKILLLGEDGMEEIRYEETEHYAITKQFLNNHKSMLDILLEEQLEFPLGPEDAPHGNEDGEEN